MKDFLNIILDYLIFGIWYVISLLPLGILYLISDLFYPIIYYIIRYRRKIIRKNLVESFPEKSVEELVKIEKEFYHFFCDYVVETVKMFSMGEKEMRKRMTFSGTEVMNEMHRTKSCVLYLGHYCNWEWVSSLPLHVTDHNNSLLGQIYHKLENPVFDRLFLYSRYRFKSNNIEMFSALRTLVKCTREGKRFIIGFISDQSPNWNFINMWTNFLNHKTSFFVGAESIAKMTNAAVFYIDMKRVKRGYYHGEFILMTDNPKSYPNYELTVEYGQYLERTIRRNPQYWLWSHNRWKRTYEQYVERSPNGTATIHFDK